jgi:hypothetical protein
MNVDRNSSFLGRNINIVQLSLNFFAPAAFLITKDTGILDKVLNSYIYLLPSEKPLLKNITLVYSETLNKHQLTTVKLWQY